MSCGHVRVHLFQLLDSEKSSCVDRTEFARWVRATRRSRSRRREKEESSATQAPLAFLPSHHPPRPLPPKSRDRDVAGRARHEPRDSPIEPRLSIVPQPRETDTRERSLADKAAPGPVTTRRPRPPRALVQELAPAGPPPARPRAGRSLSTPGLVNETCAHETPGKLVAAEGPAPGLHE